MRKRWFDVGSVCFAVAVVSLLSAPILALGEVRTRLDPKMLMDCRGRDIDNSIGQLSCSLLNKNFTCPTPGGSCNTCDGATYSDVIPGDGGYDASGKKNIFNICGVNYQGSCVAGACNTNKTQPVGVCQTPPAPPVPQP